MGIGLELFVSRQAHGQCRPDSQVRLKAWLQIAESGLTLFGFADSQERELFLALTTVKGVGGKMAMTLLQGLSATEILTALTSGDSKRLTTVPGVGKKTAERLCFELGLKLEHQGVNIQSPETSSTSNTFAVVMEALEGLGFDRSTAQKAFAKVQSEANGRDLREEDYIFRCLGVLRR